MGGSGQKGPAGRAVSYAIGAVLGRLRKRFAIPDSAVRNMRSFSNLLGGAESGLPLELFPLASDMWTGFMLTPFAEQQMQGWVFPYWLRQQHLPSSRSFIPHGHFWLECNMTHRDWTGIGICGFPNEASVDPRGMLTPWPFGPSVDVWLKVGDGVYCPSELEEVSQSLEGGIPVVRTEFEAGGLGCSLTAFVARVEGMPLALCRVEVTNARCQAVPASVVVSVRPANTETICAINELEYGPSARTFLADGSALVCLGRTPEAVLLSDYAHGDVAQQMREPARERLAGGTTWASEPFGLATGAAVFDLHCEAGKSEALAFACPLSAGTRPPLARMLPEESSLQVVESALAEQRDEWKTLMAEGMTVKHPDAAFQRAFDVNKAWLLMLFDGRSITPGVTTYHMMWFRDAAYLVPALERLGRTDMAADILSTYPDRQTPEGFFCSHSGEWDSNGQALYTLVHHYRVTGDTGFLTEVYPSMMKAVRWLDRERRTDLPQGDPCRGLLPPGISAEHFGTADTFYWDDLWAVGGLRAFARAARDIGMEADARFADEVAASLWDSLEASWAAVEARLGRKVMPIAPFRDVDAASIGCIVGVYPLGVMDVSAEIMSNTIAEIIERCFYRDTHFHSVLHCGLNAYLSLQMAQCLMTKRDPYALTIFDALVSMATPTFTFPEAINPLTGGGAYGDGHHGWAVSEFVNFLRNLLLREDGDKLVLLGVSRAEWFAEGKTIEVNNAPSYFGEVSYSVECSDSSVTFNLPGDLARPPSTIVVNLPFAVASCTADGEALSVPEGATSVEVPAGTRALHITR